MSNAQRRRKQRQHGRTHPGPMTPERVAAHRLAQMRLADLERLRKIVVAKLAEEERESKSVSEVEEWEQDALPGLEPEIQGGSIDPVTAFVDELRDFLTAPGEPEDAEEGPEVQECPCGHPDAADGSLGHILVHNRDEVSGAVTLDWSGADLGGGYPTPYMMKVKLADGSGVQLYPARVTVMSDAAASLAVVDVTELVNADGDPIRSNTSGKMGVHTEEYKAWNNADHEEGDAFPGDKFQTVVSRFVLASSPEAA